MLGSMSDKKSLMRACSEVQRRVGSRVSIRSSRSRAAAGKLEKSTQSSSRSGRVKATWLAWQHLYVQGKFFPQSPPILFFGLHGVEERKFDDVRPHSRTGTSTQTASRRQNGKWKWGVEFVADVISRGTCPEMRRLPDELQLQELLVGLEYWPFGEELSQNTSEP